MLVAFHANENENYDIVENCKGNREDGVLVKLWWSMHRYSTTDTMCECADAEMINDLILYKVVLGISLHNRTFIAATYTVEIA